jgi:hypothetical protein
MTCVTIPAVAAAVSCYSVLIRVVCQQYRLEDRECGMKPANRKSFACKVDRKAKLCVWGALDYTLVKINNIQ